MNKKLSFALAGIFAISAIILATEIIAPEEQAIAADTNISLAAITTVTLPSCQWCGKACMRVYPWMACPDIAPPSGFCGEINGQCRITPTPTPTVVPTKYSCNIKTGQCVLTYGGGQYDTLTQCQAECQPTSCGREGEKLNRNPFFGATDRVCCSGLTDIRESKSYSVCVNCGDKICKYPENSTNCPTDCQSIVPVLPECQWCGVTCMRVYPWMACPDIAPPPGRTCTEIDGKCVIAPTTVVTILPTKYNCAYKTGTCVLTYGEGQYDTLAQCQAECRPTTPTTMPTPQTNCTNLQNIINNANGSSCGDAKYNPIADITDSYRVPGIKDGKVDFEDLMVFALNANNESWCQEQLSLNYNPCNIGEKARQLLSILSKAYRSSCGDAKYNPIADIAGNGGAIGNPAKDGKVDFEDLMVFALNANNESWCQEHLEARIHLFNPCPFLTTPKYSCDYRTGQCKLVYGEGQYDTLAQCQAVCRPTTPTTLPPCQWCGVACMRVYPWMACPDIAPPPGRTCTEIDGKCVIAPTTVVTILPTKYNCAYKTGTCVLTYGEGQYDTLAQCQAECRPTTPTTTTTTTTTPPIPIKYSCDYRTGTGQCKLVYGGGQYDTLAQCQAVCRPTTPTTLPPCQWCGVACMRVYPWMACPDIVHPKTLCCEKNGQCVSGFNCHSY